MAADNQLPLLDVTAGISCCAVKCDESSGIVDVNAPQFASKSQQGRAKVCKATNCHCRATNQRLNSQDSGLSLNSQLNPIAEHACHCFNGCEDGDEAQRVALCNGYNARNSARYETTRNNNNACNVACGRCEGHGSLPQQLHYITDERRLIPNGHIGRKFERMRSKSESCRDSFESEEYSPTHNYVRNANYVPAAALHEAEIGSLHTDVKRHKSVRKVSRKHCKRVVIGTLAVFVLSLTVVAAIVFYRMGNMEDQIEKLERALSQTNETPAAPVGAMQISSPVWASRPHAHFRLKVGDSFPLTPWKQTVLQWDPVEGNNEKNDNALQYNSKRKSLVVNEPGTYFVYNQIYVYRHLPPSAGGLNKMKNHTLFHAIYNRPFNYPTDRKPLTITESTLTNCWNENAKHQIHTSYQGIIVNLQKNDELLVALKEYNDKIDTLEPQSTFFGAFKL